MRAPVAASRGFAAVLVATIALVVLRSYIFLRYGPAFFDSDQAVIGLMAKHLSEGRGFPLFFYGQNYMLGVEAWLAAPFFRVGGPTVAMLRLPLVLLNIAVGVTFAALAWRRQVPALLALVVTLPLIVTTPLLSDDLVTALGASIEPFLYVAILWALRHRPVAFGLVLAFATLHREFTLLAGPAVAVALALEGRGWPLKGWMGALAAAGAVWVVVDVVKWHTNTLGIAGGSEDVSSLWNEARTVTAWVTLDGAGYRARLVSAVSALPLLFGGCAYNLRDWALDDSLVMGSVGAGLALGAAVVVAAGRLVRLVGRPAPAPASAARRLTWPIYLGVIALETLAVYGLNGGIDARAEPVTRYLLFLLLAPVALLTAWAMVDRSRPWRGLVAGLMLIWAVPTTYDNVRWIDKLRATAPAAEFKYLAADLMAHGVRYGRAQYWDAYVVTFLSRERVIVASTDKVRIGAYQALVDAHADEAVSIVRAPCTDGRHVAAWCVSGPGVRGAQ